MIIQAIDYKSNRIFRAYKNGVIIWRQFNAKYFSFGPNNILLIHKNILGNSFVKKDFFLNNEINLIENYSLSSDEAKNGEAFIKVGPNIFDKYSASRSRECKKIEIISSSSTQSLSPSLSKRGEIERNVKAETEALMASSRTQKQNSEILLQIIHLLKLKVVSSIPVIARGEMIESAWSILNSSLTKSMENFLKITQWSRTQYKVSANKKLIFRNQGVEEIKVELNSQLARQVLFSWFLKEDFKVFQRIQHSSQINIKGAFYDLSKVFFTNQKSIQNYIKWATNFGLFVPLKSRKAELITITHHINTVEIFALFYLSHSRVIQLRQFLKTLQLLYLKTSSTEELIDLVNLEIDATYSELRISSSIEEKLFNKVELKLDYVTLNKSPTLENKISNKILFEGRNLFYQSELETIRIFKQMNVLFEKVSFSNPEGFGFNINYSNIIAIKTDFKNKKAFSSEVNYILKLFQKADFVNNAVKKTQITYTNVILEKGIFINETISESIIKTCEKIESASLFINSNIRKTFGRYVIAVSKASPQFIDGAIYSLNALYSLAVTSASYFQNSLIKEQKIKLFSKIDNYNTLGMSTNLVTFQLSERVYSSFVDILLLQKLYEHEFYVSLNSMGHGLLEFLVSYGNFNETLSSFEKILINFTKYIEINKILSKNNLIHNSVIKQSELFEINKGRAYIKIYDNITLSMSNYSIISQDFYYNINYYLSAFFALSVYHWNQADARSGFYNFATLNFAGDDEKWHYPIWNSEVEAERNNIFITQVFNFSYNTGEIK